MTLASTGAGVMKRITATMIDGMVSSTILTLWIPVRYGLWHDWPRSRGPVPAQRFGGFLAIIHEQTK
jgi:Cu/Ag efflux pump CusA